MQAGTESTSKGITRPQLLFYRGQEEQIGGDQQQLHSFHIHFLGNLTRQLI